MTALVHRTDRGVVREARVCRTSCAREDTVDPGGSGAHATAGGHAAGGTPAPRVIKGGRGGRGKRIGIFWSFLCGGGVETVNRDIADRLPRDQYIVDAFVWQAEETFVGLAESFDELVVLDQPFEPIGQPGSGPFTPIEQCASFQKLLTERHYDLFIVSCCWAPFWLVHMHGIPIIEFWHGFGCWNGFDMPSQAIVAVSQTTRGQIEAIRPSHAPVTVIRNAVEADRYAGASARRGEARKRFGLPPEAPVVLYCGRFSAEKRPQDAMAAFVKARETRPDLQLLMVGTIMPGWSDYYVQMGTDLGLRWGVDAWHYVLPHDEIGLAFAAADVMLHPSEWEGLGMVLLEGLSAELPIISTCAGGCGEVLDGVAVKVAVGDTEAMAEAINGLLGNARKREAMRRAGQERVRESFGIEAWGKQIEAVVGGVIGD